jgi:hypothetical protein
LDLLIFQRFDKNVPKIGDPMWLIGRVMINKIDEIQKNSVQKLQNFLSTFLTCVQKFRNSFNFSKPGTLPSQDNLSICKTSKNRPSVHMNVGDNFFPNFKILSNLVALLTWPPDARKKASTTS